MATLQTTNPTLLDLANVMAPDSSIAKVIEILDETNEMLADMVWIEGNLPTGHQTTIRTGIPTPTWRKIMGGVQPNKSTTVKITHSTGMLEAFSEVDIALADIANNAQAFRLSEDIPHIEGMSQEVQDTLIYGNETSEPEAFTGLTPHYNLLTAAESSDNVIAGGSASGQTDNGSIWLVVWDESTIHGIMPQGSTAGLKVEDMGKVVVEDASNGSDTGRMVAYRTHYRWDAGLAVRDWRYAVRICNIDKSLLSIVFASGVFSTGAHLPNLMFQAMRLIPSLARGKAAFYMSRDMATTLAQQASAATQGSTLTHENVGGKLVERFHGIPVRRVDSLSADEARVA